MSWRRFYTAKSNKLMLRVRLLILITFSPLWLPLYLTIVAAYKLESLLDWFDDILQKILDKFIPQIK